MLQENQKELSQANTNTLDSSSKSKSNISISDIESQKEVQIKAQIEKQTAHNWSWYLKKVVKAGVALLGTAAAIGGVLQVAKTFRKGQKSSGELSTFGDDYRNGVTPSDINTTNIGINSTNNYLYKVRNELGDLVNITKDDAAKINETVGYVETPVFVGHENRIKEIIPSGPKTFPAVFNLSDLNGTNGFKLDGEAADDYSGCSVSGAGDINGDGIDDLIIGARGAAPSGKSWAGRSYVVFGKKDAWAGTINLADLNGTNGFKLDGEASDQSGGDQSGYSVSSAGDINGDGIADLVIGAPFANNSNSQKSGRTYVIFGKNSSWAGVMNLSDLNGTNGFKLDGEAVGDYSGYSVSGAGDINGDGIDDLIIGAYQGGKDGAGRSYVVFGKTSTWPEGVNLSDLNGTNGFKLDGYGSGNSVDNAGDINGDGIDDLIIGASCYDPEAGRSYVVFGKNSGWLGVLNLSDLNGTNGFKLNGVAMNDYTPVSTSNSGDINGDGIDDFIIGAVRGGDEGADNSGWSFVVFGKNSSWAGVMNLSDLNGTNGFKLDGEAVYDHSGYSVSAAGDINGDGIDDLIIGGPDADSSGKSAAGRSYVVFGKKDAWAGSINLADLNGTNGFKLDGEAAHDQSGYSVSAAGDINGDGFDDLIVGAYGADPSGKSYAGRSYVVFGRDLYTPDINANQLNIGQGQRIVFNASHLNITDPVQNASRLAITVGNISHGAFEFAAAKGIPATSFSMQEILDGKIGFAHDGSTTAPSYNVTVSDGTNIVSELASITFNTPPAITANSLTVTKGQTVVLSTSNLNAGDLEESAAALTFTVSNIQNGFFDRTSAQGTPITSFTLQEIQNSEIRFVHDDSTNAPIYSVSVSDGKCSTYATSAAVMFDGVSLPVITANTLAVNQGAPTTLSAANLNAADVEHTASQLTFTVSDVLQGYFDRTSLPGTSITTFTLQEIQNSEIRFIPDGSATAPSYKVAVGDGTSSSAVVAGTITFNKPPVLTSNSLSLFQGQTVTLGESNLNATDTEQDASELIFTASDILHGSFDRVFAKGIAIEKFSLQEIKNAEIRFVHDGGVNAPSCKISVSDGTFSTAPVASAIVLNKTPLLTKNKLSLGFGQTVTLNTFNLDAVDAELAAEQLAFTASEICYGAFYRKNAMDVPITTFTKQEIATWQIKFKHDGSANAPRFKIAVSDGVTSTMPAATTIKFITRSELIRNATVASITSVVGTITTALTSFFIVSLLHRKGRSLYPLADFLRQSLNLQNVTNFSSKDGLAFLAMLYGEGTGVKPEKSDKNTNIKTINVVSADSFVGKLQTAGLYNASLTKEYQKALAANVAEAMKNVMSGAGNVKITAKKIWSSDELNAVVTGTLNLLRNKEKKLYPFAYFLGENLELKNIGHFLSVLGQDFLFMVYGNTLASGYSKEIGKKTSVKMTDVKMAGVIFPDSLVGKLQAVGLYNSLLTLEEQKVLTMTIAMAIRNVMDLNEQNTEITSQKIYDSLDQIVKETQKLQDPAQRRMSKSVESISGIALNNQSRGSVASLSVNNSRGSLSSTSSNIVPERVSLEAQGEYLIPYCDLEFGKVLGEGGFGAVFKGTYQGGEVAIKKLNVKKMTEATEEEFKNETAIMAKSKHPNIITLYGYSMGPYCIVMELMTCTLFDVLHNKQEMPWNIRLQIAQDIIAGLLHLHSKAILHRDLKSLNVLLSSNMRAKLTDFGLSKLKNETKTTTMVKESSVGTIQWMAPELFGLKPRYSKSSDIYGYGMILWEVATREVPYSGVECSEIGNAVRRGERADIPEDCPIKISSLINFCWMHEANKRPTAETISKYLQSDEKEFKPSPSADIVSYRGNLESSAGPILDNFSSTVLK